MRIKEGWDDGGGSQGWESWRRDALFLAGGILLLVLSWAVWFFLERGPKWEPIESWVVTWTGGANARGLVWYSATILSDLGHGFLLGSLLFVLWIRGMKRARFQEALLWLLLAGLFCALLKVWVGRVRPFGAGTHSWPSGHSAAAFSMALFLATGVRKPWAALFLLLGALIGASRVFHLRHYPSDVLGGFALALFLGPIVHRIPLFLPPSLEASKPRQLGLGVGLFVFLFGIQGFPPRPDLSVGFLGLFLFLGLSGLLGEGRA